MALQSILQAQDGKGNCSEQIILTAILGFSAMSTRRRPHRGCLCGHWQSSRGSLVMTTVGHVSKAHQARGALRKRVCQCFYSELLVITFSFLKAFLSLKYLSPKDSPHLGSCFDNQFLSPESCTSDAVGSKLTWGLFPHPRAPW